MPINYRVNDGVSVTRFIDLLQRSGLADRRPVEDRECLQGMLAGTNLMVSAQEGMKLIGLARCLTDFHYVCYLSDLAVDSDYQRQGIGRELVERVRRQLGPQCKLVLLSAPDADSYYPRLGFERHERCWVLPPGQAIESGA